MAPEPVDFQIQDAQGNLHEYTVQPHSTTEGTRLCLRIMAMAGEPIGRLVSSNIGDLVKLLQDAATGEGAGLDAEIDLSTLGDKIKDLDLDFAQVVRDLQVAIAEAGDEKFFQNLFRHTFRDGKPMAKVEVYERAYVANYMEQFQAAIKVIGINGFLPFFGMS